MATPIGRSSTRLWKTPESVFYGATLAEAAEKAGVDAEGLAATIERYNGFVADGVDEDFGRDRPDDGI